MLSVPPPSTPKIFETVKEQRTVHEIIKVTSDADDYVDDGLSLTIKYQSIPIMLRT